MKLWFRLFYTLVVAWFRSRTAALAPAVSYWRVLPTDIDIFGHMNNGRYGMMMDLARIDYLVRTRFLGTIVRNGWIAPNGCTYVDFRGGLRPFEAYRIETSVAYWDERWFYFRQDFHREHGNDKPVATGWVKMTFAGRRGRVTPQTVLEALGEGGTPRPALCPQVARAFHLDRPPLPSVTPARRDAPALANALPTV